MRAMRCAWLSLVLIALLAPCLPAAAASRPLVAIIIDDIGNNYALDARAVALPGPVTYAFLPDTPYAAELARRAHGAGKEVLLHLPLEAIDHAPLGPGGLTLDMTRRTFVSTVRADLAAIPDVEGVNNHMGSLLTQHPGDMGWLMTALKHAPMPLFYVDSRTTAQSVAFQIAEEHHLPATWRDVFLDDVQTKAAITHQLARLIAIAKRRGTAVAIGHPYPVTLRILKQRLPKLATEGVELVPVRAVIARQAHLPRPEKVMAFRPLRGATNAPRKTN